MIFGIWTRYYLVFGIWYLMSGIWYLLKDFHHGLTLPLGSYSCLASSPDLVMSLDGEARSVKNQRQKNAKMFLFLLARSFFYLLGLCAKAENEASFICSVVSLSLDTLFFSAKGRLQKILLYHILLVITTISF